MKWSTSILNILNENVWSLDEIYLKSVSMGAIDQVTAWNWQVITRTNYEPDIYATEAIS